MTKYEHYDSIKAKFTFISLCISKAMKSKKNIENTNFLHTFFSMQFKYRHEQGFFKKSKGKTMKMCYE